MGFQEFLKQGQTPVGPVTYFKAAKDCVAIKGLKIGIFGGPETAKTHFVCTCPPPIYIIDTEFGAAKVARKFPNKEIYISEVAVIDTKTEEPDPDKSIQAIEGALKEALRMESGTVAIDSVSDFWFWLGAWVEETATKRIKSTGDMVRFEWGRANERYRNAILSLLAKPITVVLTAHEQSAYDSAGNELPQLKVPRWQKDTPYWVDLAIHSTKIFNPTMARIQYLSTIDKCRLQRAYSMKLEDMSYDLLKERLEKDLKVDIQEYTPKTLTKAVV